MTSRSQHLDGRTVWKRPSCPCRLALRFAHTASLFPQRDHRRGVFPQLCVLSWFCRRVPVGFRIWVRAGEWFLGRCRRCGMT